MNKVSAHASRNTARKSSAGQAGFTLLEVLIAMLVLAIALYGLVRSVGDSARHRTSLLEQTLATWVASNAIEMLRLREPWPTPGRRQGREPMGEQNWYWEMDIAQTEEAEMRRLDVAVFRDPGHEQQVLVLSGFVGQPN